MNEVYISWTQRQHVSSKKIREMKKKALQSYEKIPTIKEISDKESEISSAKAEKDLDSFMKKS